MKNDGYDFLLGAYIRSIFQDFEGYFRTKVDLAENDIELFLKQSHLNFITYEVPLGAYTTGRIIDFFDEISKGDIKIEYDDITIKTKLFGRSNIIRLDDKSFVNSFLGFESYWDYKPRHTYTGGKL